MATTDLTDSFATVAEMKPAEDAVVHGVIRNVSPMKKGASPYFDAKICDGDKHQGRLHPMISLMTPSLFLMS